MKIEELEKHGYKVTERKTLVNRDFRNVNGKIWKQDYAVVLKNGLRYLAMSKNDGDIGDLKEINLTGQGLLEA